MSDFALNDKVQRAHRNVGAGNPVEGTLATGTDAYVKVLDVPDRTCGNLLVQVDTNDVVISLDGGITDHLTVKADSSMVLTGLAIGAGVEVQAKNATASENFTDLIVAVW